MIGAQPFFIVRVGRHYYIAVGFDQSQSCWLQDSLMIFFSTIGQTRGGRKGVGWRRLDNG